MKNMIEKVENLNGELDLMIFQLDMGIRLISLCKEKKKTFLLYNPLLINYGMTPEGQPVCQLVPYQPPMSVESSNTVIRKKKTHIFVPSEDFKNHYLFRLQQIYEHLRENSTKEEVEVKKVKKNKKEESANNVMDFSTFRKYQKAEANVTLAVSNEQNDPITATANTDDPIVA